MAHMLDFSKGFAAIAYRGEVPWHGFGSVIDDNDSIESMVRKAGLDWSVERSGAFYEIIGEDGEAQMKRFDNRDILYRSDTGVALSMVSENSYKVRQPAEIVDFIDTLCKHAGLQVETLGSLQEGKKIWAMASVKDGAFDVGGGDMIAPYFGITESFDKTLATQITESEIRFVCYNTVSYGNHVAEKAGKMVKQRHNKAFNPDQAIIDLAAASKRFEEHCAALVAMTRIKMTDNQLGRFFTKIYAPEAWKDEDQWKTAEMDYEELTTNKKNVISALLETFRDNPGSNLLSSDGTLYGALNTITYYQDHCARTRDNKRWESATIGQGAQMKAKALELAQTLI